jgi:hypothetical protein
LNPKFNNNVKCPATKFGGTRTFNWLESTAGVVVLEMRTISSMLTDFRKVKDDYDTPAEIIIQKIWSYGENF